MPLFTKIPENEKDMAVKQLDHWGDCKYKQMIKNGVSQKRNWECNQSLWKRWKTAGWLEWSSLGSKDVNITKGGSRSDGIRRETREKPAETSEGVRD